MVFWGSASPAIPSMPPATRTDQRHLLRCPLGEEGTPDSAGLLGKHWVNGKAIEKAAGRQAIRTFLQGMYGPSFITPRPTSSKSQLVAEPPCPPQEFLEHEDQRGFSKTPSTG